MSTPDSARSSVRGRDLPRQCRRGRAWLRVREEPMSAASKPLERPMTVAEFLAYDDGTETRHELVNGVLVAMNPPATRHVQICQNIGRALAAARADLAKPSWSSLGVAISDAGTTWRQPDLIVNCARPSKGYYKSPRLVVEVLSPSTEKDDRTTKLDFYESLPSVEAILLVWQEERRVRLRERGGGRLARPRRDRVGHSHRRRSRHAAHARRDLPRSVGRRGRGGGR